MSMNPPSLVHAMVFVGPKIVQNTSAESASSSESEFRGYAIVPRFVIYEKTVIFQLFTQNAIQMIDSNDICQPFASALSNKQLLILDFTVYQGAEISLPNPRTVRVFTETVEPVKRLLSKGALVKNIKASANLPAQYFSALHEENFEAFKNIFSHHLDVSVALHSQNMPFLHYAAMVGHEELLKIALDYGADMNAQLPQGLDSTPLHLAAEKGNTKVTEILLHHGADTNLVSSIDQIPDRTPLHWAVSEGFHSVASLLMEYGANVDIEDIDGRTCLLIAVEKWWSDLAKGLEMIELILRHNPSVQVKGNAKALSSAVLRSKKDYKIFVEKLLICGFRVNSGEITNSNLMHDAVQKNYVQVVEQLLELGAAVDIQAEHSTINKTDTPLLTAASCSHEEIARILVSQKANVNAQCGKRTPLLAAIKSSSISIVKLLLENGADIKNPDILCTAAEMDCAEIVELLLLYGANPDGAFKFKRPLKCAVKENHLGNVKMLLKFGVTLEDKYILRVSLNMPGLNVAEALLRYGAQLDLTRNTFDFQAITKDRNGVWEFFLEYGFGTIDYSSAIEILRSHVIKNGGLFGTVDGSWISSIFYYLIKLKVANLLSNEHLVKFDHVLECIRYELSCFYEYDQEVELLKQETICDTGVSFYDILTSSINKLIVYARNPTICDILSSDSYTKTFQFYGQIVYGHFQKALHRKKWINVGVNMCEFGLGGFAALPHNVKEDIISYLDNEDIRVLVKVFRSAQERMMRARRSICNH